MPDSMQAVIAGVYRLLGRPAEARLPYRDVLAVINDLLKGYVQDLDLSGRDQLTQVADVTVEAAETDYHVTLPEAPDFEAQELRFSPANAVMNDLRYWGDVRLVPYESFRDHAAAPYAAGSFYGSLLLESGQMLRLNLTPEEVANTVFRLAYRLPLLRVVQSGERPPLPANFLPMLKYDAAVDCMPLVRDRSDEWRAWVSDTTPRYEARVLEWKARWQEYLRESIEGQTAPLRPFNSYRRGQGERLRPFVPRQ